MGLKLIYWTSICGKYFFGGSLLDFLCEKYGNTAVFPGEKAATAGLGYKEAR